MSRLTSWALAADVKAADMKAAVISAVRRDESSFIAGVLITGVLGAGDIFAENDRDAG